MPFIKKNIIDCSVSLNSFYKYLKDANFNTLTKEKIEELFETSKQFNKFFTNKNIDMGKSIRYEKIVNKIKMNPRLFNTYEKSEMYLLFMFSIDPEFEAFKIYGEFDKIKDIKSYMIRKFGVYDPNLINLEKLFIKHFMSKQKKEQIEKEIEDRVYKK